MNKAPFVTITLDFPVQLADRELSEVSMRRPTVGDEVKFAPTSNNIRTQAEEEARYFAHLCGITVEEMKQLDMGDYDKLQKQYLVFRGRAAPEEGFEADGGTSLTPGENVA